MLKALTGPYGKSPMAYLLEYLRSGLRSHRCETTSEGRLGVAGISHPPAGGKTDQREFRRLGLSEAGEHSVAESSPVAFGSFAHTKEQEIFFGDKSRGKNTLPAQKVVKKGS